MSHFCHWGNFNWGSLPLPPLRTPMLQVRKTKKVFANFSEVSVVFQRNFNCSKIVLFSSRGQGNFRGLEASRPRPRTSKCVLEDVLEAKDVLEDSTSDCCLSLIDQGKGCTIQLLSADQRRQRQSKNPHNKEIKRKKSGKKSCLSEVESRTQGSRPRPRTQKKSEAKAKDSLSEIRHFRGQGQECSRPRPRTKDTSASALQKKKGLHKNFSGDLPPKKKKKEKRSSQNIVLSLSRGQTNFRGLEASRPRPRT